jgi:hypothetical protein
MGCPLEQLAEIHSGGTQDGINHIPLSSFKAVTVHSVFSFEVPDTRFDCRPSFHHAPKAFGCSTFSGFVNMNFGDSSVIVPAIRKRPRMDASSSTTYTIKKNCAKIGFPLYCQLVRPPRLPSAHAPARLMKSMLQSVSVRVLWPLPLTSSQKISLKVDRRGDFILP